MTEPGRRQALTLHAALIAWALVRALALWPPSMHAWGLNFGRTVPPGVLLACGALLALALVPALGRRLADRLADPPAGRRRAVPAALGFGALAVVLVWLLPDRTYFVGDALLRLGVLREPASVWSVFPQAMPLDRVLHWVLPNWLAAHSPAGPETWARVLGALEAAVLAGLALRFARGMGVTGAARIGVACALLFGGYFALFTGYGKPTVEVVLCTLAAGVFGLDVVREGRGALPFAIAVSLAVLLHRAALPLLPVWLVVAALDWRARGFPRWHRELWPHLLPPAVLLALSPLLVRVLFGFDLGVNVSSHEVAAQGGVLRTAFSGLRLLDVANVLLLHAPLLPVALAVLPWARERHAGRAQWVVVGALGLAFVPELLFVYVTQGPFRDWDAYGGAGAAAALAVAFVLARVLRGAPARAWLGVPVALSAALPAVLVLGSQARLDDGLARVHHFLDQAPVRTVSQRASTLDFIGSRCMRADRWGEAALTYEQLADVAPSARVLLFWGTSAAIARRDDSAERAFVRLTQRVPAEPMGWFGLWLVAGARGDTAAVNRAGLVLDSWSADGTERAAVSRYLDHYPELAARLPRPAGSPPGR